MHRQTVAIIVGSIIILTGAGLLVAKLSRRAPGSATGPEPTPAPINVLPFTQRPYATLQPLVGRNELELAIFNLPKPADSVEVTLEYDRNKGIMDAVLKQFALKPIPLKAMIFLGTKSAGGHITYHDDVIGGSMTLKFIGSDSYTLKVPWRYDDSQKEYQSLSTTDGFFQIVLDKPLKQPKIVVMQSPGAPPGLTGEVVAGPYLLRTVGDLPKEQATVKIRLSAAETAVTLWGYDGTTWTKVTSTLDGKTVSANSVLYQTFAVTK